jgi:peptidoglycan/xylan/chitin deacetylase (PgdA/CDA1 family)
VCKCKLGCQNQLAEPADGFCHHRRPALVAEAPHRHRRRAIEHDPHGHEIACHTCHHLNCGRLAPADIADEIDRNAAALTSVLGAPWRRCG